MEAPRGLRKALNWSLTHRQKAAAHHEIINIFNILRLSPVCVPLNFPRNVGIRWRKRRHIAACTVSQLCHNFVVVNIREFPMSIDSHLSELVRRHQAIEEAIQAEENHPASDDIKVHELKRKKLHLKDQIERLRHQAEAEPSH
jgi:hypothetical protein